MQNYMHQAIESPPPQSGSASAGIRPQKDRISFGLFPWETHGFPGRTAGKHSGVGRVSVISPYSHLYSLSPVFNSPPIEEHNAGKPRGKWLSSHCLVMAQRPEDGGSWGQTCLAGKGKQKGGSRWSLGYIRMRMKCLGKYKQPTTKTTKTTPKGSQKGSYSHKTCV